MARLPFLLGVCSLAVIPVACGDSEENGGDGASSGTSGNGGRQSGGTSSGGSSQGGSAGRATGGGGGTSGGGVASGGTSSAGEGGTSNGGAGEGGTPGESGAGGDGGIPDTGGSAGSGGGAGSAGSAGTGGGAGNGGSAGSGGSAGGNAGAGSGGMAGSAGTAGVSGVCEATTPRHLAGTISGNAFDLAVNGGSSYFRNQPLPQLWDIRTRLGTNGLIHLFGLGALGQTGSQGSGIAHWMMPAEGPSAGVHLCADAAMTNVSTFRRSATLTNFTTLGVCPAVPGNGSLMGCFGLVAPNPLPFACNDDQARLVGDIAGDDIDASYVINTDNVAAAGEAARFLAFGDRGVIALYGTPEASRGFIQFPFDGVNPGGIYCVGSATITPDGTDYTFSLGQIGLLGTCPASQAVSGEASGCL